VRDWHFPLEPACREGVAWAKYKDRFRLGFSSTLAVCGLRPEEEALIVPDMQSNAGECLSDGWGEVSVELAEKVGLATTQSPGAVPFQFRYAGAKGIATVSKRLQGRRLVLRESQVKIKAPTPWSERDAGVHVLEVIQPIVPDERKLAKFNKQLILVLSSLMGVDRLLLRLRELQQQEVQRFCRAVSQLSDSGGGGTHREETSGTFKRSATQPTWSTTQSTEAPSQESQASRSPQRFLELAKLLPTEAPRKPPAKEEVLHIRQWLRCGAPLGADPHAFDRVVGYLHDRLLCRLRDRKFECPRSCRRKLAPDPTRTIGPRQVVLKQDGSFILGDILVARNPCQLPSDVQVFEGVDGKHIEETHQVDGLLILSSHPSCPRCPAQLLAGGDHDGDDAFITWWSELVQDVKCVPDDQPFTSKFTTCSRDRPCPPKRVGVVTSGGSRVQDVLEEECASAARNPQKWGVGCFTNLWETAAEFEPDGAYSDVAVELALLCREAVDAPKTGWQPCSGVVQRLQERLNRHSRNSLNPRSVRGRLDEDIKGDMACFERVVQQCRPNEALSQADPKMHDLLVRLRRRQDVLGEQARDADEIGKVQQDLACRSAADGLGTRAATLATECIRDLLAKDHAAGKLVMVPVLALRWTHDEVNRNMTFKRAFDRGGARGEASVYALVRDLLATWHPRRDVSLTAPEDLDEPLDVCVFDGQLWSLSNRRLAALMMFQSLVPQKVVRAQGRLCSAFSWRFYGAWQTTTAGLAVAPFRGESLHLGAPLFGAGAAGSRAPQPSSEERGTAATVLRVGRADGWPRPPCRGLSAFGDYPPATSDPVQLRWLQSQQPGAEFRAEVLVLHVPIHCSDPPEASPASQGPSPFCLLDQALRRGRACLDLDPADVCLHPDSSPGRPLLCAASLEAAARIAAAHMFQALRRHEEVTLLCRWCPGAAPRSLAAEAVALHHGEPLFPPEGAADAPAREAKRPRRAGAP